MAFLSGLRNVRGSRSSTVVKRCRFICYPLPLPYIVASWDLECFRFMFLKRKLKVLSFRTCTSRTKLYPYPLIHNGRSAAVYEHTCHGVRSDITHYGISYCTAPSFRIPNLILN